MLKNYSNFSNCFRDISLVEVFMVIGDKKKSVFRYHTTSNTILWYTTIYIIHVYIDYRIYWKIYIYI